MSATINEEAIVLSVTEVGEEDRILTFLTRESGLVRAAASSAANLRKGRSAALDLFVRTRISIGMPGRGGSLRRIRSAEILDPFMGIRGNYLRLCAASYMGQTTSHCVQEEEEAQGVYDLVRACMQNLDSGLGCYRVLLTFEVKILRELGMLPELGQCMVCGGKPDGMCWLHPREGGIVHGRCREGPQETALTPGDLSVLRYFSSRRSDALDRLGLPEGEARRLFTVVHDFAVHHLGYEAKVFRTLKGIGPDSGVRREEGV